jgi:hypothetical protein
MTIFASLRSAISRLLFCCGPPDIARLVVAIIVNSVYRMAGSRFAPNVFQELIERLKPKLNTSPSVVVIVDIGRVLTPGPGAVVRIVFRRRRHVSTRRLPVSQMRSTGRFPSQASATRGVSIMETVTTDDLHLAAITTTFPLMVMLLIVFNAADNCKSAEFFTCDILECSHAADPPLVSGFGKTRQAVQATCRVAQHYITNQTTHITNAWSFQVGSSSQIQ